MIFKWEMSDDGWYIWSGPNANLKPKFKIEGDLLYKVNPYKLNDLWRANMLKILELWRPPQFDFIENGYVVKFIDGKDLHGNVIFTYNNDLDLLCNYDPKYLPSITNIYSMLDHINNILGITFIDTSPSNIILDPFSEEAYLVDFDDISVLTSNQKNVWNYNKNLIFAKNKSSV